VVVLVPRPPRIEDAYRLLPKTLGAPRSRRHADHHLGTATRVLCGLSALPDDFRGVVVVSVPATDPAAAAYPLADWWPFTIRAARVHRADPTLGDPTRSGPRCVPMTTR